MIQRPSKVLPKLFLIFPRAPLTLKIMLKKIIVLSALASALAIPAPAFATWTKDHQAIHSDAVAQITGEAKFEGEVGWVECQTVATLQLLAETTTATLQTEIDVQGLETVTSNCSVGGVLPQVGCTDVKSETLSGLPWTVHAVSTQTLATTTALTTLHLHGGIFCPKQLLITPGTTHTTTSTSNTWTTGQLSGTLQSDSGGLQNSPVQITGHGGVTPSGVSGVA
jgi:hypothetical protein